MDPAPTDASGAIRRLATAAIAGQAIWFAVIAAAGAIEPGYSEARDAVGFLGARNAAHPWVFWAAVTISGISYLALAAALILDDPPRPSGLIGPLLIGFAGIAQVLNGFFLPVDCRSSIDAGCKAREVAGQVSWQHPAHEFTFFIGGTAVLLSVFAMAWRFHGDRRWGSADRLALYAGLLGLFAISVPFVLVSRDPHDLYGLAQRLALTGAVVWIIGLAVALLVVHPREQAGLRLGRQSG